MALALGERDPRPPITTFLETKLCLRTYAALKDTFLGEWLPFVDQLLAFKKEWICQSCLILAISEVITDVVGISGQCLIRGSCTVGAGWPLMFFVSRRKISLSSRRKLHWNLMNWWEGRRCTAGVSQRSGNGIITKKIGTNTTMHCKQTSPAGVAGWDMKIGVTIG